MRLTYSSTAYKIKKKIPTGHEGTQAAHVQDRWKGYQQHKIVGVSVYSDVLTSESNVSFAPTMQNKIAAIIGIQQRRRWHHDELHAIDDRAHVLDWNGGVDEVGAEEQHFTSYYILRLEF